MPLTPVEMDFMTNYVTELHNFDRPMPAHEMFWALCEADGQPRYKHSSTMNVFEFLWQEQSRAENIEFWPYTDNPPVPPFVLPWPSAAAFKARSHQLYPESVYLEFARNDHPFRYNRCWSHCNRRYFSWHAPEFTEAEIEFLDAYYQEIESLSWGPCLELVKAAGLWTGEINRLVGYRAGELLYRGEPWPVSVTNPMPPLPWPNKTALELRTNPPGKEYPAPSPTKHPSIDRRTMGDQEKDFLIHYFKEITSLTEGPAHQFMREKGIDPILMTPFLSTAFMISTTSSQLLTEDLPPFHGPWYDKDVFLKRLEVLTEGGFMNSKVRAYVKAKEDKQS
jgi:hypothetical protein